MCITALKKKKLLHLVFVLHIFPSDQNGLQRWALDAEHLHHHLPLLRHLGPHRGLRGVAGGRHQLPDGQHRGTGEAGGGDGLSDEGNGLSGSFSPPGLWPDSWDDVRSPVRPAAHHPRPHRARPCVRGQI